MQLKAYVRTGWWLFQPATILLLVLGCGFWYVKGLAYLWIQDYDGSILTNLNVFFIDFIGLSDNILNKIIILS